MVNFLVNPIRICLDFFKKRNYQLRKIHNSNHFKIIVHSPSKKKNLEK